MKIGVIADTHISETEKDIPPEVLNAFKKVDMVIHAGDLVDPKVLDMLRGVCKDVRAVWGNMDPYEVRKDLPEKQIIEIEKHRIGVVHGYGHPSKIMDLVTEIFKKDNVDLIIFGHSHAAINEKRGDILYFNPGSPTDKVFAPWNSYGIIEINDKKIEAKIIKI
ncbi:MAG: metallophosphoesterase family protein [Candidatus Omnitrophica bacterium]|nr:metallophosphoesterase family protein [Candidatus Omnitrophota bacterium]